MGDEILAALEQLIHDRWPAVRVYRNPMEQGAKTPCFFLFHPGLTTSRRLFAATQQEGFFQIVYLPSQRCSTPCEENGRVLEELLRRLVRLETGAGVFLPLELTGEVDGESARVQLRLRWKERHRDSGNGPLIGEESTNQRFRA